MGNRNNAVLIETEEALREVTAKRESNEFHFGMMSSREQLRQERCLC